MRDTVYITSSVSQSVTQSCPSLCNLMDCSTPGFPVHHQTPRACSNSRPSSQWCHPTISFSVIPFTSCLQSFPESRSFQMSQLFVSGGQRIEVSASASILPMNVQDWFPLGWTGLIFFQSEGLSTAFFYTTVQKHQFFGAHLSLFLGGSKITADGNWSHEIERRLLLGRKVRPT